jgi:hypothetical protein
MVKCRDCDEEIEFYKENNRWIPYNTDNRRPHNCRRNGSGEESSIENRQKFIRECREQREWEISRGYTDEKIEAYRRAIRGEIK